MKLHPKIQAVLDSAPPRPAEMIRGLRSRNIELFLAAWLVAGVGCFGFAWAMLGHVRGAPAVVLAVTAGLAAPVFLVARHQARNWREALTNGVALEGSVIEGWQGSTGRDFRVAVAFIAPERGEHVGKLTCASTPPGNGKPMALLFSPATARAVAIIPGSGLALGRAAPRRGAR